MGEAADVPGFKPAASGLLEDFEVVGTALGRRGGDYQRLKANGSEFKSRIIVALVESAEPKPAKRGPYKKRAAA